MPGGYASIRKVKAIKDAIDAGWMQACSAIYRIIGRCWANCLDLEEEGGMHGGH
jgi:hypothetical protein